MKKYTLYLCILSILLIILAFIIYSILNKETKPVYTTAHPFIGSITQNISASGTLSPTNDVDVGTQVSGTIYKIYVDVNDVVKKDQILAEINPNKLKQTLEGYEAQKISAKANLQSSEVAYKQKLWTYEQQKKLFEVTKGASPSQLELENSHLAYLQAKADIDIKRAALNQIETNINAAKIDLQNSVIKSPIDGIILTREVSLGQTVAASFNTPTLFTLAENLKDMKLIVNISESDIGKVMLNQKVTFSVDAYPDQVFEARINRINFASTTTDNITSYQTSIFVNNDSLLLRPGMSATANIQIKEAKDALLIPIAAIFYQPKSSSKTQQKKSLFAPMPPRKPKKSNMQNQATNSIYILRNGKVEQIPVKLGVQNAQYVQIISPKLDLKTLVITDSQ